MPFVERLQEIRLHKAVSQYDLASRAGLSIASIKKLETGEQVPCCKTLDALATALEVPVYELFYDGLRAPRTPWLSPRPSLEDLQKHHSQEAKAESGLLGRVRELRDGLGSILR